MQKTALCKVHQKRDRYPMTFDPTRWTRLPVGATAVWLCPDRPAWFVPTAAGDRLLQKMAAGGEDNTLETAAFLQRLPDPPADHYPGRASLLPGTPPLRELWLHITDRCNLACSHCLFSSGPDALRELSTEQLVQHLDDAASQ
jgi:7,8-dihydro-6-hydroxymethylpterin dimethyltransferase